MMDYIANAQTRGGRERLDQKGETRRDKTERNGVAKYNTRRYAILLRLETARWSSTFKSTNIVLDSDFIVIVVLLVGSSQRKSQYRKVNSDETNKLKYNLF